MISKYEEARIGELFLEITEIVKEIQSLLSNEPGYLQRPLAAAMLFIAAACPYIFNQNDSYYKMAVDLIIQNRDKYIKC